MQQEKVAGPDFYVLRTHGRQEHVKSYPEPLGSKVLEQAHNDGAPLSSGFRQRFYAQGSRFGRLVPIPRPYVLPSSESVVIDNLFATIAIGVEPGAPMRK